MFSHYLNIDIEKGLKWGNSIYKKFRYWTTLQFLTTFWNVEKIIVFGQIDNIHWVNFTRVSIKSMRNNVAE